MTDDLTDLGRPSGVRADFVPTLDDLSTGPLGPDPYLADSEEAQRLFDLALAVEAAGDEAKAAPVLLRACKHAEAAREWYLVAISAEKAGNIFRTPEPPYDLRRAFRIYQRAIAAYHQCGHYAEGRQLEYQLSCLKVVRGGELGLT